MRGGELGAELVGVGVVEDGEGLLPGVVGGFGAAFELGILRQLYGRDGHAFLMVTFGLTLVMGEAIRLLWGVEALQVKPPPAR